MADEEKFNCPPNSLGNMSKQNGKTSALFFATVYTGFLCLLLIACGVDRSMDDMYESDQSPAIDPDKFTLDVKDAGTRINNFVAIKITPGSPSMNAEEFFVTASIVNNNGIVKGAVANKKKGSKYTAELKNCNVATLAYTTLKPKQDTQGSPIKFKVNVMPDAKIKEGDSYTLDVKIERKVRNSHTETHRETLNSRIDGEDQQKQTKEGNTSNTTNIQTPATALGTVLDNAIQSINHPTLHDNVPVNTEVANTIDTSTILLGCDTDLPILPSDLSNTNTSQRTDPSDSTTEETHTSSVNAQTPVADTPVAPKEEAHTPTVNEQAPVTGSSVVRQSEPPCTSKGPSDSTTDDHAHSTDTNRPIATSERFTVKLKNKKNSNYTKNFVIVTIHPDSSGMALRDFFVTATLADGEEGTVMGSSGKNENGFVYNSMLDTRSLEAIFLIDINCLGVDDISFTRGKPISFRIEAKPGASLKQGDQYTLTVQIAYTGSNAHTETQDVKLTAPRASPVKKKKRTSPRK